MDNKKIKLAPPWQTYVSELVVMFGGDPEIRIVYDDPGKEVKLYVSDTSKAEALSKILPIKKRFGNMVLKVTVVFPNLDGKEESVLSLFKKAFRDNPVLEYTYGADSPFGAFNYVVFRNQVVQFYNDQIDDINGNKTTLFQEIAKDLFNENLAVNYCTEAAIEELSKPLGEWP